MLKLIIHPHKAGMDEKTKEILIEKTKEYVRERPHFQCRYGCRGHIDRARLKFANPSCSDGYVETMVKTCGPDYYFTFNLETMEVVSCDRSDFGY